MPELARLRAAGVHIWPHDPARLPLAVEIYPRHFTGRVNKSQRGSRQLWLQKNRIVLADDLRAKSESGEDAFDAAASALAMARHAGGSFALPDYASAVFRIEGRIWRPRIDEPFGGQRV
jgi:hypothetical protein